MSVVRVWIPKRQALYRILYDLHFGSKYLKTFANTLEVRDAFQRALRRAGVEDVDVRVVRATKRERY